MSHRFASEASYLCLSNIFCYLLPRKKVFKSTALAILNDFQTVWIIGLSHLCGHWWYLLQEKGMVEGLTWDCSDEFDATSEQPISFLSDQSFISFPNWISRTGAMVSFKVNISKVSTVHKCTTPEIFSGQNGVWDGRALLQYGPEFESRFCGFRIVEGKTAPPCRSGIKLYFMATIQPRKLAKEEETLPNIYQQKIMYST